MFEADNNTPVEPSNTLLCKNCGAGNPIKNNFCSSCGKPLKAKLVPNEEADKSKVRQILFFLLALVLMLCIYGYTELFEATFWSSIWIDIALATIVVVFSFLNFKETYKLYSTKNVRLRTVAILSLLMVVFAFVVNYVAGYINTNLFGEDGGDMLWIYRDTGYPLLLGILLIGLHPALFEELAFRGFLFNNLLHFSSPKSVIITTGLLFAFVHFSFISFLWLIPIGLFFGYLRFRYRNLWYSTICHFIYNSTIVLIEYFQLY